MLQGTLQQNAVLKSKDPAEFCRVPCNLVQGSKSPQTLAVAGFAGMSYSYLPLYIVSVGSNEGKTRCASRTKIGLRFAHKENSDVYSDLCAWLRGGVAAPPIGARVPRWGIPAFAGTQIALTAMLDLRSSALQGRGWGCRSGLKYF